MCEQIPSSPPLPSQHSAPPLGLGISLVQHTCLRKMAVETDIAVLMLCQTAANLRKGISKHKFVECGSEHGCGDIGEDRDPGVALVCEDFDSPEHGCNDTGSEVTRHISGDS